MLHPTDPSVSGMSSCSLYDQACIQPSYIIDRGALLPQLKEAQAAAQVQQEALALAEMRRVLESAQATTQSVHEDERKVPSLQVALNSYHAVWVISVCPACLAAFGSVLRCMVNPSQSCDMSFQPAVSCGASLLRASYAPLQVKEAVDGMVERMKAEMQAEMEAALAVHTEEALQKLQEDPAFQALLGDLGTSDAPAAGPNPTDTGSAGAPDMLDALSMHAGLDDTTSRLLRRLQADMDASSIGATERPADKQ